MWLTSARVDFSMCYSSVNTCQNHIKICTLKVQDDVQLAMAKFCLSIKDCRSQDSFNDFTIKGLEPKILKENCNAKASSFHMKERSKCWRTICISLETVKLFSSYLALKSGRGITKGESPYFRSFRKSSVI